MSIQKNWKAGGHPAPEHPQTQSSDQPVSRSADAKRQSPQPLNYEQQQIVTWLKKVRFRRTLFGGVSENDVWKKIEALNSMYDMALRAERARYDVLLESRAQTADAAGCASDTPPAPGNEDKP